MKHLSKSYKQEKPAGKFDAIIIGSGLGGMSTAAFLSKEGKRVLVLERHYTPGGFTHVFRRKEYEWDVGVHYVGDVHRPYTMMAKMFNYVTDGSLKWEDMGQVYDKIFFGKELYEYHKGEEAFSKRMKEYFPAPEDQQAIDEYLKLVRITQKQNAQGYGNIILRGPLKWLLGGWLRKNSLKNNKTTLEVLRSLTKNEKLIGVLTGQFGDYGLPPSQSSFVMHATLFKHYLNGGNYPVGGSARIYESVAPVVLKAGGEIYTNAEVKEIIIQNNKAVGVKMLDGDEYFAPVVISSAGIVTTYSKLVNDASVKAKVQNHLHSVTPSVAHVCLYVGLNHSKKELNLGKANYWIYPGYNHDKNIKDYLANPDAEFPVVYISFPTAKDPDWENRHPNHSTIEIITLAPYEWFKQWENKRWMKRGEDYHALKEKISQRLLQKLYEYEPSLKGKVDYYELSTPLSTRHFVNYQYGEIYGIDHSPQRFALDFLKPQTPIENLYLTGQDTVTCGVGGALASGMFTASVIEKKNLMKKVK
jgi:all-trans-retinol 13,14-reductase